jgi:ribosomal protein S18 acetylase RimI-like enzyme
MNTAYSLLKERGVSYLWCNARTSAIGFYEKLGMKVISEEFEIPVIGPHKVMIRHLN